MKTFKLTETNVLVDYPCDMCGGIADSAILCESEDGMRICEHCLKERDFDDKLQSRADRLEEQARKLPALIGQINPPSYEEYVKFGYELHAPYLIDPVSDEWVYIDDVCDWFESYPVSFAYLVDPITGEKIGSEEAHRWINRQSFGEETF